MVILHHQKMSHRKIAGILGISKHAVTYGLARADELGTTKSRTGRGRPRKTTITTDRRIRRAAVAHPTWSSTQIATSSDAGVSPRTVRMRLLKDFQLPSRKPAKKAKLSKKNIKDRLTFCRKYKDWTAEQWKNVMFSDESTFSQFSSFVRHVRRPKNQRYNMRYVVPTVKQAPTTMVWASFCGRGRGGLWFMPKNTTINGPVYLSVLQDKLVPHMQIHNCTIFQHDGAPCHRTKAVGRWLEQEGIEVLGPWPGSSPDLNPIENLWTLMKRHLSEKNPTSENSLKDAIKQVWTRNISVQYCETLAISMPARIKAVLANKGQHTKY
jgi:transposase